MEATRENLVRLSDIIREVRTQLNAISRQAKKAEQFKILKKAVKEAELAVSLQAYSELSNRRNSLDDAKNALKIRDMDVRTRMQGIEAALEELKADVLENENLISAHQEKLYNTKNAINIKEQGREFARRKIDDLAARRQRGIAEGEPLREREG